MNYHEIIDNRAADVANRAIERGLSVHDALLFAERFAERCIGGHPGTFGVEYIDLPGGDKLAYLNAGDTYTRTLCSIDSGPVFVSTWGDCYEASEREYELETDTIRCGHCGEFTPVSDPWDGTVCEYCGSNVAG